jgi:5-methylthioadenosine/S-adenosylhomocysteine deaminase
MVTRAAARALGLETWVGSLETGKRADVTVVSTGELHLQPPHDPYTRLTYTASGRDVTHVFVDGEMLVDNGQLVRDDREQLLERARSWQERVAATLTRSVE